MELKILKNVLILLTYLVAVQAHLVEVQAQPQAVPVYDLFISKLTYQKILVSSDLGPDLDPFQEIARVFSKPSNHDPHTSHL